MKGAIVIGDPHGCFETFKLLVETTKADFPNYQVCVVGDIVDRGPKSAQLIEYIINNNILSVMGNHEAMMLEESDETGPMINMHGIWMINGGIQTLKSYHKGKYTGVYLEESREYTHPRIGLDLDLKLWEKHRNWISKLPYYLEFKDLKDENGRHLLITHSSAHTIFRTKPENRMKESNPRFGSELMWNRIRPIKAINNPPIFNVFGHSPRKIRPETSEHHANVDTGACFSGAYAEGYGRMSAMVFPEKDIYQIDTID